MNLTMKFFKNNLGENNTENLKQIGKIMKYLPSNLRDFSLILLNNHLGENTENLTYLI